MQIQGRNPVLEALKAGMAINRIVMKEGIEIDPKISQIIELAKEMSITIVYKPKRYLQKLSEAPIHQGVIATLADVPKKDLNDLLEEIAAKGEEPFLIFIRDAQNEANIGAIIRSAEAAGAHGVILPPKLKLSPVMIRTSMGATAHIPLLNVNLFQCLKSLRAENIKIVGIEMNGTDYYYQADLKGPLLLIIGGEDRSLSSEVQGKCDQVIKIPMKGKVNSLNMSVAAAIVIFDKLRQESN